MENKKSPLNRVTVTPKSVNNDATEIMELMRKSSDVIFPDGAPIPELNDEDELIPQIFPLNHIKFHRSSHLSGCVVGVDMNQIKVKLAKEDFDRLYEQQPQVMEASVYVPAEEIDWRNPSKTKIIDDPTSDLNKGKINYLVTKKIR